MKDTFQTRMGEFEKIWDEEEMCTSGCPDNYCREVKFKAFLKRVWEEAEKVGRAKGMEGANEDWKNHLEGGFAFKHIYKAITFEDIYTAIKKNMETLKQTT